MAKCTIEIEDDPDNPDAVKCVSTFDPDLPLEAGKLNLHEATNAQRVAVHMLNAVKQVTDASTEDFVVGREGDAAPYERLERGRDF